MADSKTIWRGSGSAKLTITSIQTDTAKNGHISKYAFYCNDADLTGNITDASTNTTTIKGAGRVNKSKDYTITSYLIYRHTFGNGSTTATSNKVNNTITVHEPLNNESLKSISINDAWVWSNANSKSFTITPTFDTYMPFSYEGQYISDSITPTVPKGYIQNSTVGDITGTIKAITWYKTTGGSTDLGERLKNIKITAKSTAKSAPSAAEITDRYATIEVRNAVTRLDGLSDESIFGKATTNISQTVNITPSVPYSDVLTLVSADGSTVTRNSITKNGSILTLDGNNIALNTSHSNNEEDPVEFKFKVRSTQGAEIVDTDVITFTVSPVKNLTVQPIVEGQTTTIQNAGIGEITHAEVTSGPIEVLRTNGAGIELRGKAVDANTDWTVTIQNGQGTTITISGTTTALADITVNINSGDFIVLGKTTFGQTLGKVASVSKPAAGKASVVNDGEFKFEAYNETSVITAGRYSVVVTGTNGATQKVWVVVSDIAVTVD